jgi:hypothetical protein
MPWSFGSGHRQRLLGAFDACRRSAEIATTGTGFNYLDLIALVRGHGAVHMKIDKT